MNHTWIRIPTEDVKRFLTAKSVQDAIEVGAIIADACRSALNQEVVELEGEVKTHTNESVSVCVTDAPYELELYANTLPFDGPVRILIVREGE